MIVRPRATSLCRRRRGSIYPAVLAYASLVTIIGLSALLALRLQRRASEGEIDFSQARMHARSAIEMGLWVVENNAAWRSALPNGVWLEDRPIGSGTYTLEVVDPNDGDFMNSDLHPLVLTGTGVQGAARHKTQLRLEPPTSPLGCLEVSLHAGNDLKFNAALLQSNQIISANNSVDSNTSTIDADVEAVNVISGSGYTGTSRTGIDARSMPNSAVFDYYLDRGTPISILSMPTNASGALMEKIVLSPASNPYGVETNPTGIYVIDCQGTNLEITLSRIVGTLVLKNPGSGSIITQSVNWEPAIANYPALMVSGSMKINLDAADLSESALSVNFNPLGTPRGTIDDADQLDDYPSVIKGLVYVSGDLLASGANSFEGSLIVGVSLDASGVLDLEYDSVYFDNPPPGFFEVSAMRVVAGSWKQVVD